MSEHMNKQGLCFCGDLGCVGYSRAMLAEAFNVARHEIAKLNMPEVTWDSITSILGNAEAFVLARHELTLAE